MQIRSHYYPVGHFHGLKIRRIVFRDSGNSLLPSSSFLLLEPVDKDVIPTVVKRKKKKGKRKEDLSSLPVETISHTLSEEELTDIFGENGWKQLPDETYMRVKVEPAKYTVEEHHICVYAGKTTDKIVKAFRPKSLLRNSIATPFPRCEYNEREICKWDAP